MKLRRFPFVVFRNIATLMDPITLTLISFCSKDTKERVRMVKFYPEILSFVACKGNQFIYIKLVNDEKEYNFLFDDLSADAVAKLKRIEYEINGIKYNIRLTDDLMILGKHANVSIVFNVVDYVLDLFRIDLQSIVVDCSDIRHVQHFVSQPRIKPVSNVCMEGKKATALQLYSLFHGLSEPLHNAFVFPIIEGEIDLPTNLFGASNVFIKNAGWVKREHLLSNDSEFTVLMKSTLTTDDIISFVQQWLDGNDTRLQSVIVYFERNEIDTERVLNSFEGAPWDPAKRSQSFVFKGTMYPLLVPGGKVVGLCDCADGFDLERQDGTLATIRVPPHGSSFFFYIWHNRFHTVEQTE